MSDKGINVLHKPPAYQHTPHHTKSNNNIGKNIPEYNKTDI